MDNPIQVDLGRIAQDLQIRRVQVESVVQLLDDGNTVPFITRYRKEQTGNLNEVVIHEIQVRVHRLRELAERKETILKAIEAQGKLVPDLAAAIRAADNPKRLEDLYLPFKPKKRTKASDARDRGLEPLAFQVWTRDETLTDLAAAAQQFVNADKGVDSVEKVIEGVGHILAEAICEMAAVRDAVRRVVWKTGKIVTAKSEIPEGQGLEYRDYFEYSEPVAQIPPHRVLAINRGDKEGPLKVRLDVPRPEVEAVLFGQLPLEGHPHAELFRAAAIDSLDRLILPSMEREVRRDLTEGAERHAVEVFAKNLRSLLLQPPIPKQIVLAIDPGFKTGCKLAVLDRNGDLLEQGVIYPHPPQNRRSEAKVFLKDLVGKHKVGVVAIGNGTACRETEELVAEIIAEGTQFSQSDGAVAAGESAPSPVADAIPAPEAADAAPLSEVSATSPTALIPGEEPHHEPGSDPHGSTVDAGEAHSQSRTDLNQSEPASEVAGSWETPGPQPEGNGLITDRETTQDSALARESLCASEPHASPPAEAPLEALPPISGGAPGSISPDPEIDAASGASPPSDPGSTALLDGGGADERDDAPTAKPEPGSVAELDTPHHEPETAEGQSDSSQTAQPAPAPASPALAPLSSEQPLEAVAPGAPGQAEGATSRPSNRWKRRHRSHRANTRRPPQRSTPPLALRGAKGIQAKDTGRIRRDLARRGTGSRRRPRLLRSPTPPTTCSPSSPMSLSTRPAPASTRPARSAATSYPTPTRPCAVASRSVADSRIRWPSWSRSSPRTSAWDCTSTTSTRSSSRIRSKRLSPVASISSVSI